MTIENSELAKSQSLKLINTLLKNTNNAMYQHWNKQ